jgi:hypothetical protein
MLESILNIKKDRFKRNSQAFSFFQAKPINMIIASRNLEYVRFRDLKYLDDETEFFKRYYNAQETVTRLRKLISILVMK